MRLNALHAALEHALPTDARSTFKQLMSSMEDIQEAIQQENRQAALADQALTLTDTIMKECGSNPAMHETMSTLLTQIATDSGVEVVSTEGLGSIFSSLSGFFKTRKPNGELPSEDGNYQKRQQAIAKFIVELDKTYLNSSWLSKQKFVEGTIKAGDISANFVIDGKLGDHPLDNVDTAKKRVQAFIRKWEPLVKEIHTKVKAIDARVQSQTKGAALDDEAAIQKVRDAIKEFEALPNPIEKLPKMEGTSLGNKTYGKDKHNCLAVVVTTPPTSSPTLPALNKEQVMHAAGIVKMMLKGDWEVGMEWFSWLDHSDGSAFNHWIYDADNDAYMDYYHRFYHQGPDEEWVWAVECIFDTYPLAAAMLKWIDRSVV